MTIKSIARAIKQRKPAIIREKGEPRYVLLDWETYRDWEALQEDMEDSVRLARALADSKNQKRYTLGEVRRKYHLL